MTYRAWNTKEVDRAALKELTAAIAQQNTEELENQSMDDGPWSEEKYRSVFAAQQKEAGLLAGILAARGITDPAEALTLLAGEEELSDPMLLTDMDKACARILRAIDEGETIVVFGDYDVDGVTATALLYQHLKGMGASAKCMLPSREGDGYGLSKNAIQSIYDKGCRLIVTVDNGISAVEEAAFAASLGIDLIITDHHLPHESLPQAVAIVDPRRADDHSPFKGLCGAGVAFKLCAALDGCPPEEMLEYCGDLAAVGTVADVMPLTGENRTIVKAGLRQLQNTDRPGFCALLEEVAPSIYPATVETARRAVSANPFSASAHHLLGHCLFRTGDYEGASAAFKESENLCLAWEKAENVSPALDDAYFRSILYRAVSEFCAGRYKRAEAIASRAASVPLDKKHPLAPGTLLQLWEARTLPARLMLARPGLPRQALVLKAFPGPLPKGFPDLSNGMTAVASQYMGACYAARQGRTDAVASAFDKMSGILRLLMDGADAARRQMSVSYWARCLQTGSLYSSEIRSLMFPDSANVWMSEAIRSQRFSSLLLPPVVPYPAEWVLARAYLKAGKFRECADMCEQALKRFPNHAGVLETLDKARSSGK